MEQPRDVDGLYLVYQLRGSENYGEGVDMLAHALQCATLAAADGAGDELVAAALLHDVGHLVADLDGHRRLDLETQDDVHEAVGARTLAPILGPAVAQPVALHVTAKRWRCTVDPGYRDRLSPTSRATLQAQGGLLDDEARRRFESHPGFADALRLRDWDDLAKQATMITPSFEEFRPLLERLAARAG